MCALDPLLLMPRIEYAQDVYELIVSAQRRYCLVILDMKNFHVINDVYGYEAGDQVIHGFMRRLRKYLPSESVGLRFRHGDEFLFFLPIEAADADSLFRRFRDICETRAVTTSAALDVLVSYKFAVVDIPSSAETVEQLLERAEKALREVKGQGSPRGEFLSASVAAKR